MSTLGAPSRSRFETHRGRAGQISLLVQVCVSPVAYLRYEYQDDESALQSWRPADAVGLAWTRLRHDPITKLERAPPAVEHAGGASEDATLSDLWTFPRARDEAYTAVGSALHAALAGVCSPRPNAFSNLRSCSMSSMRSPGPAGRSPWVVNGLSDHAVRARPVLAVDVATQRHRSRTTRQPRARLGRSRREDSALRLGGAVCQSQLGLRPDRRSHQGRSW